MDNLGKKYNLEKLNLLNCIKMDSDIDELLISFCLGCQSTTQKMVLSCHQVSKVVFFKLNDQILQRLYVFYCSIRRKRHCALISFLVINTPIYWIILYLVASNNRTLTTFKICWVREVLIASNFPSYNVEKHYYY